MITEQNNELLLNNHDIRFVGPKLCLKQMLALQSEMAKLVAKTVEVGNPPEKVAVGIIAIAI